MSIRISGPSVLSTPANTLLFNASQAAISCRIKIDAASGAIPNNAILFGRSTSQGFVIQATTISSLPAIKVTLSPQTGSTNLTYTFNYVPGRAYHLVALWDAINLQQTLYLNGYAVKIVNISALMQNGSATSFLQIGSSSLAADSLFYMDDCYLWSGTVLTDSEIIALRDRTVSPSGLYPSNRVWGVSLDGPNGVVAAAGDSGLADSTGGRNLSPSAPGTGSLIWSSDSLGYDPEISTSARILSSGGLIAFYFKDSVTNAPVYGAALASNPTVSIDGGSSIALSNPIASVTGASVPYALYALPGTVSPSSQVTFTAAPGWSRVLSVTNTSYPPTFTGGAVSSPVAMGVGQSNVPYSPPTMQLGLNLSPGAYWTGARIDRNMMQLGGAWFNATAYDSSGKPTAFSGSNMYTTLPVQSGDNGLDALKQVTAASIPWLPDRPNIITVVWDEASPGNNSNFRLRTLSNNLSDSRAIITERPDLASDPADGKRRTRAYEISRPANPVDYTLMIRLYCDRADWSNLNVFGPGNEPDFVDLVDEATKRYVDGANVVRFMDASYTNNSPVARRDQLTPVTDFNYTVARPIWANLVSAGPASPLSDYYMGAGWMAAEFTTSDPHGLYTGQVVSFKNCANLAVTYSTTLVSVGGINATATTLNVAAPGTILANDYIAIDSEWMLVTAVSNATLTVSRGVMGTTAASHSANATVTCYPSSLYIYDGVNRTRLSSGFAPIYVTSPTTFVGIFWHGVTSLSTNTVTALPNQIFAPGAQVGLAKTNAGLPYERIFQMASSMGINPWINIPFAADDDCVRAIAEKARDYLVPGRKLWVEFSNELWNTSISFLGQSLTSNILANKMGMTMYNGPRWGALRAKQIHAIFEEVLGAVGRDNELVRVLGWFWVGAGNTRGLLDFCLANNVRVDALAIAPYRNYPDGWATVTDGFDVERMHDVWQLLLMHGLPFDSALPGGAKAIHRAALTATYPNAQLVCYEGSIETILSSSMTNVPARAHDLFYHPRMYDTYRAFLSSMQNAGISLFCHFQLINNVGWPSMNGGWMMYAYHGQPWGRGDGSDGKANNLACMTATKPANVQQDFQNVSVMGQVFKDWAAALPDQSFVLRPLGATGSLGSCAVQSTLTNEVTAFSSSGTLPDSYVRGEFGALTTALGSTSSLPIPLITASSLFVSLPFIAIGKNQPIEVVGNPSANPNTLEYLSSTQPIASLAGRSITSSFDFYSATGPFVTLSQIVGVSLETAPQPLALFSAQASPQIVADSSLSVSPGTLNPGTLGIVLATSASSSVTNSLGTDSTLGSPKLTVDRVLASRDLCYFLNGEPIRGITGRFATGGLDSFRRGAPFAYIFTSSTDSSTSANVVSVTLGGLATISIVSASTTSTSNIAASWLVASGAVPAASTSTTSASSIAASWLVASGAVPTAFASTTSASSIMASWLVADGAILTATASTTSESAIDASWLVADGAILTATASTTSESAIDASWLVADGAILIASASTTSESAIDATSLTADAAVTAASTFTTSESAIAAPWLIAEGAIIDASTETTATSEFDVTWLPADGTAGTSSVSGDAVSDAETMAQDGVWPGVEISTETSIEIVVPSFIAEGAAVASPAIQYDSTLYVGPITSPGFLGDSFDSRGVVMIVLPADCEGVLPLVRWLSSRPAAKRYVIPRKFRAR